MIATTKLNPTAAPHTEIVSMMVDMGSCEAVKEVEVKITSIVNIMSIIVSRHIRASIRCLCCKDKLVMVIMKVV